MNVNPGKFERWATVAIVSLPVPYYVCQATIIMLEDSPLPLLKAGSIIFPLAILIYKTVEKIFDALGWKSSLTRAITISIITHISATTLGVIASLALGIARDEKFIHSCVNVAAIGLSLRNAYSCASEAIRTSHCGRPGLAGNNEV